MLLAVCDLLREHVVEEARVVAVNRLVEVQVVPRALVLRHGEKGLHVHSVPGIIEVDPSERLEAMTLVHLPGALVQGVVHQHRVGVARRETEPVPLEELEVELRVVENNQAVVGLEPVSDHVLRVGDELARDRDGIPAAVRIEGAEPDGVHHALARDEA